jgi:hypothetical protein
MIDFAVFVLQHVSPVPMKTWENVPDYDGNNLQSRKGRRILLFRSPRRYPLRLFHLVGRFVGSRCSDGSCNRYARGDRAHPKSKVRM